MQRSTYQCGKLVAHSPLLMSLTVAAMPVQEGAHLNVVFMDNDIFVFKSLARIFENEDFHYGCTISDSKAMPVRATSTAGTLHHIRGMHRKLQACSGCPAHLTFR